MWTETEWQKIVEQSEPFEFDWYGIDRLGQVAVFSSYGSGLIPEMIKHSRTSFIALYDIMKALPDITEARVVINDNGRYDDWIHYSKQGLFGYDNQDAHRSRALHQYDLLTVPLVPIKFSDLEVPVALTAVTPQFDVEFGIDRFLPFTGLRHSRKIPEVTD